MAILKTEHLTYVYSKGTPFEKTAVDNVNLCIEENCMIGVIGHTGSGKSTLIQHFNGLLQPTSGKIYLENQDIWADKSKLRDVRFQVGLVFQYPEYQLFEETVFKDIAFGVKNMNLSESEIKSRVLETAQMLGIASNLLNRSPFALSGGQKRRVAIAGVMAMRPKVLILDEPCAGLDPKGRNLMLKQIQNYQKQSKSTVLLVSHSMEDVAEFTEKLLVMNHGKLFCYEDTNLVFRKAEELQALGLKVPQIASVMQMLRKKGYDLPEDLYTVEQAKLAILELLRKGDISC
ncbi:MAG: energy-coupling factor transporter ATPase [Oscillospiraceae bacterium]|nr:energy-coupling factor transporter ATPase [Oscillospiraceae bacterium]MDE7093779.1 energy-coupling factor transporter ATPase [Oscillospiraceae bacterium]